jgi:hypothetical protein
MKKIILLLTILSTIKSFSQETKIMVHQIIQ